MYAITLESRAVTGFFACITAAQLAVGIYLIILAMNSPGMIPTSVDRCALGSGHRCLWPLAVGIQCPDPLPSTSRHSNYVRSPNIGSRRSLA